MKKIIRKIILIFVLFSGPVFTYGQCEILNRIAADGSMRYYMAPVNFYQTNAKSLKGCIVTDRESYLLELQPFPFPAKPAGNKLKEDLDLKLSNGVNYRLKHFDTRYASNDTVMKMLFYIDKKDLELVLNFDVFEAKIDMKGTEGVRTYQFKLHKSALREQLACFLKDEEERKKK